MINHMNPGKTLGESEDQRRHLPATARNRDPILNVLRNVLPRKGKVLEVASGSGEHVVFLAAAFPELSWQPSDMDQGMLASISAWIESSAQDPDAAGNILPPLYLDTRESPWPVEQADAVIAINMIHISPWPSCVGLMEGAGRILPAGGVLYLYGSFMRDGRHTHPNNAGFDATLRRQNPEWGVRNLEDVAGLANESGLVLDQVIDMPANNLSVVFKRT